MAQGEAYGAAAIPAANCLERVDDVFADMTMPHQPGARAPGHRPWRAPLQQVLGLADLETQQPITADSSFISPRSQSKSLPWRS